MANKIKKYKKSRLFFLIPFILLLIVMYLELSGNINVLGNSDDTSKISTENYPNNVNNVDYSPPKPEDTVLSPEKTNTSPKVDNNSTKSTPISVLITRASRESVGIYIEKISGGTCELKITQKGIEKISMTAKVLTFPEYSSCEGFTLDSLKLDDSSFNVTVSVKNGDRTGSASQEVN